MYVIPAASGIAYAEKIVIANNTISGVILATGGTYTNAIAYVGVPGSSGARARYVTITGNFIDNTSTALMMGVRIEVAENDITISGNQIRGAYYGIYMTVGANNTTSGVQIAHNNICLQTNGTGLTYSQDTTVSAYMQHVVVMGNVVRRMAGATGTLGINNSPAAPTSLVLMGNDVSDTNTAYNNVPTGIGNLP
ncbi:hypothetical protein BH11MYX3_BH11MYX3_07150 [soil metagenome]